MAVRPLALGHDAHGATGYDGCRASLDEPGAGHPPLPREPSPLRSVALSDASSPARSRPPLGAHARCRSGAYSAGAHTRIGGHVDAAAWGWSPTAEPPRSAESDYGCASRAG